MASSYVTRRDEELFYKDEWYVLRTRGPSQYKDTVLPVMEFPL